MTESSSAPISTWVVVVIILPDSILLRSSSELNINWRSGRFAANPAIAASARHCCFMDNRLNKKPHGVYGLAQIVAGGGQK
jgi:hypothetical protein